MIELTADMQARLEALPPAALAAVRDQLAAKVQKRRWELFEPYPWQVCPGEVPAMGAWVLGAGRGCGKSAAGSRYVLEHVYGPPCDPRIPGGHRVSIIGPTLGDAIESFITGPSGLQVHDPRVRLRQSAGGTHVIFHNGAQAKVFGANTRNDIERLRSGGNRCLVALEEAAAMRYLDEVLIHSRMGLRIGPRPHSVVTSTPKPRDGIIKLWNDPKTLLTKGKTMEAWNLPRETRDALWAEYGGTTMGRQELEGEILTDVVGALVSRAVLDRSRVPEAPDMNLVVVGFDPNGTGSGDLTGIVAAGRGVDGESYVLADASTKATGREAALRGWQLFDDLDADVMVVEKNFGQSWLLQVMRDAWTELHPGETAIPLKEVSAGIGKSLRAQPHAMRWEQGRVHMVGCLDELENQWATWVPTETPDSPDRIDACVHALAYLRGKEKSRVRIGLPHTAGSLR